MNLKKYSILLLVLLLFSCKTFLERFAEETGRSENIRIRLSAPDQINVPYRKDIVIMGVRTGKEIGINEGVNISHNGGKAFINDLEMNEPVLIFSKEERLITFNDKKYLGEIKVTPEESGFDIVNFVPLETYLISVIPSEINIDSFSIEAVKAQAIVARTYAYVFLDRYADKRSFDVDDTVRYQVYGGYGLEAERNTSAKVQTIRTLPPRMTLTPSATRLTNGASA